MAPAKATVLLLLMLAVASSYCAIPGGASATATGRPASYIVARAAVFREADLNGNGVLRGDRELGALYGTTYELRHTYSSQRTLARVHPSLTLNDFVEATTAMLEGIRNDRRTDPWVDVPCVVTLCCRRINGCVDVRVCGCADV